MHYFFFLIWAHCAGTPTLCTEVEPNNSYIVYCVRRGDELSRKSLNMLKFKITILLWIQNFCMRYYVIINFIYCSPLLLTVYTGHVWLLLVYGNNIAIRISILKILRTDDFDFSSKGLNSRKTNEIQTLDWSIDFSKFNDLNSTRRRRLLLPLLGIDYTTKFRFNSQTIWVWL